MNAKNTTKLGQIFSNQVALITAPFAYRIAVGSQRVSSVLTAIATLAVCLNTVASTSAQTCDCKHAAKRHGEPSCGTELKYVAEPSCGCESNSCDGRVACKTKHRKRPAKFQKQDSCCDDFTMHRCECSCHSKKQRKSRGPSFSDKMLTSLDRLGDNFERTFRRTFDKGCCDCGCDGGMIDCDGSMCGSVGISGIGCNGNCTHSQTDSFPTQQFSEPIPSQANPIGNSIPTPPGVIPTPPSTDGSSSRAIAPTLQTVPENTPPSFNSDDAELSIPEILDNPFKDDPVSLAPRDGTDDPSSDTEPPRINRYRTQPVSGQADRYFRAYDPQAYIENQHRNHDTQNRRRSRYSQERRPDRLHYSQEVQTASAERPIAGANIPSDNVKVSFSDHRESSGPVRRSLKSQLSTSDGTTDQSKVIRASHRSEITMESLGSVRMSSNSSTSRSADQSKDGGAKTDRASVNRGSVLIKFHPPTANSNSPSPFNGQSTAPLPNSK